MMGNIIIRFLVFVKEGHSWLTTERQEVIMHWKRLIKRETNEKMMMKNKKKRRDEEKVEI